MTRPTSPFAAPPLKRRPAQKRDTAAEAAEKAYVRDRDRKCVASWAAWDEQLPCQGPLDVDHVRASGALSKKSVTHRSNMVLLCAWHHKLKTEYGRVWRPLLLAYLERVESPIHRMRDTDLRCVVDGEVWPCTYARAAAGGSE